GWCWPSERLLTGDDAGLDRQLLDGTGERPTGDLVVRVRQLEQDAPGADDRHPALGVALAGAHAGLRRLLRDGLVREDVDPHLAATLDVTGHGDTGRLDLAGGDPARLERLDPVLPVGQLGGALRGALGAPAVRLAV